MAGTFGSHSVYTLGPMSQRLMNAELVLIVSVNPVFPLQPIESASVTLHSTRNRFESPNYYINDCPIRIEKFATI